MATLQEPTFRQWLKETYGKDEIAWVDTMVDLLHDGKLDQLDYENLTTVLSEMGTSERSAVLSRMTVLIGHLLKKQYQPHLATTSWDHSIREQRRRLGFTFRESRVLKNYALASLQDIYRIAVTETSEETGLPPATFPVQCPWSLEQLVPNL